MRHLTPIAVACVASLILLGSHTASVATQSSLEDLPPLVGTSARLTAGLDHSAVVTPDGRVCTWGLNWEGQLGVGPTPAQSTEPRCFALAPDVRAVAVSSLSNRTVALTQGGQVYTWGSNLYGQLGVGSDTISSVTTPTPVPFPTGVVVVAVSASERHTIAVTDDGDLYAWGSNQYGQLGNGGTDLTSASRTLLPIPVAQGLGPFTSVAAGGSHTVATTTDGHVFAWGRNHTDQLGPNGPQESGQGPNARYSSSPVEVPGMAGVTSVAAGANHTVAVTSSGAVYTWGQNTRGQLGDRTTTTAPIPIPLILPPMAGVTAGGRTSMAWTEQGALYAWGANDYGQLGDGTLSEAHEPQLVPGVTVAAVAAGPKHTVAVGRDALVYTWGNNESGTLGDQSQTTDHTPRAVDNLPPTTQADAGDEHSLALARDGNVYAWGSNSWGQFTSDHIPFALTPVRISGLPAIAAISAGDFHNAASTAEGQVWTWGRNQYGELGRTTVSQQAPAPDVVNLQASARAVSACHLLTVALTQTDSVYGWGDNSSGQLATSSVSSSASPLLAPEVRAATSVACGDGYSLAIQGTNLYGWGSNSFGQLGARPGDPPATTPTLVTGLNGVIQADTYYRHVLALTSGGAVWALGDNPYGELGRSPAYSDNGWPVPAKITGLADVVEVAAGQNFSMALTDSGTVYTWGNNTNGQLGREAGAMSPTPTPVETLSDVVDIAAGAKHAVAVTTNGDVYTWGDNAFGQLSRPSDCWIPAQRPAAMALWEDPDMPNPTGSPSGNPSDNPSGNPSDNPSGNPTDDPSGNPTDNPSGNPTDDPSENPTDDPSRGPSGDPTGDPRDTPPDNRDSG
ncbi:MAG: hypothetical protein LBK59_04830, partial [Bifidobacteriaceae bacterium]|nr:hypothetical protein [Bifidobacteriaceae bacterium]